MSTAFPCLRATSRGVSPAVLRSEGLASWCSRQWKHSEWPLAAAWCSALHPTSNKWKYAKSCSWIVYNDCRAGNVGGDLRRSNPSNNDSSHHSFNTIKCPSVSELLNMFIINNSSYMVVMTVCSLSTLLELLPFSSSQWRQESPPLLAAYKLY